MLRIAGLPKLNPGDRIAVALSHGNPVFYFREITIDPNDHTSHSISLVSTISQRVGNGDLMHFFKINVARL
jgi:hypothetical protein